MPEGWSILISLAKPSIGHNCERRRFATVAPFGNKLERKLRYKSYTIFFLRLLIHQHI